jgi:16S rRNA processing protein RimM
MKEISDLELTEIGKFVKTFGYKGELLLKTEADEIPETELFFVVIDGITIPFFVDPEKTRFSGNDKMILKLNFVDSEKEAEDFIGRVVLVENQNIVLRKDETDFGFTDFEVYDFEQKIGIADSFIDIPGNPILTVINTKRKEILIPLNEEFIINIDSKNKKLFLELPTGLCDINS